jgi:hypothetical protein
LNGVLSMSVVVPIASEPVPPRSEPVPPRPEPVPVRPEPVPVRPAPVEEVPQPIPYRLPPVLGEIAHSIMTQVIHGASVGNLEVEMGFCATEPGRRHHHHH